MSQTREIHIDLVNRAKLGERRAQHELYQLYARPMLSVAMRILNDRMEAEDVLQECFVKAFTSLSTFRGEASFGSWLKRIVINRSINASKKKRIWFEEINDDTLGREEEEYEENGIEYTVDDIKRAVQGLPDGYRIIFSLYMFENLSHRDIASQLQITESTSKSQLNRAKKKLRTLMLES